MHAIGPNGGRGSALKIKGLAKSAGRKRAPFGVDLAFWHSGHRMARYLRSKGWSPWHLRERYHLTACGGRCRYSECRLNQNASQGL